MVNNDLTLGQQELPSTGTGDLGQSSILGQTGLQDALELTSTNLDQQILNNQVNINSVSVSDTRIGRYK